MCAWMCSQASLVLFSPKAPTRIFFFVPALVPLECLWLDILLTYLCEKVFCLRCFFLEFEAYCCPQHSGTLFYFIYLFMPILPGSQKLSVMEGYSGLNLVSACMAVFQPVAN